MSISLEVALASAPFVFWAHAQVYKAPVKVDPVPSATVKVDPVRPYTSPISSFTPESGEPEVIGPAQAIALSVCLARDEGAPGCLHQTEEDAFYLAQYLLEEYHDLAIDAAKRHVFPSRSAKLLGCGLSEIQRQLP